MRESQHVKVTATKAARTWVPLRNQGPRPCHAATASFERALETFGAKSTKFNATIGRPRSGRHFMLALPSGRFALVTAYDDAPADIEITLELEPRSDGNIAAALRRDTGQIARWVSGLALACGQSFHYNHRSAIVHGHT